ncbi:MAG: fumarylacetoacetate hydrolase family protein [Singulisphaera sp.]|nr:fumarylacetoacetate hydrolase family protein [Singulisphaera sp.]
MRIANIAGRLALLAGHGRALDVEKASSARFGSDPQAVYDRWDDFTAWAAGADLSAAEPFDPARLGAPVPAPRQVFAIGLNYRDHAAESGFEVPDRLPPTFTKWPTCITGPYGDITLPAGGHTDWEVELVAVVGRYAEGVAEADGWDHVAGVAVGQDLSERITQLSGPAPQFGLGKSFPRFGPIGPWLVTPDELGDPDDLELGCRINGEQMQKGRTRDLIFPVPALISRLSAILPLLPGDLIFTGTPAGVGLGRDPQRWLAAGDELVSFVEGIGELRHRLISAPAS